MCGRIALYTDPDRMARILDAGLTDRAVAEWQPSWNVAPTRSIFGVSESKEGRRRLDLYRWGLVPSWVKDPTTVKSTFNARAESVASKPMFRSAFESRRILVPVDEFYEWETLGPKRKQPYAFRRSDGEPIVMAGLQEWNPDLDGGGRTAAIITTEAGPDMPIHNRQPVVLERDVWDHWLDRDVTDRDELESLLRATVRGTLVHHPVGQEVGNVRNDRPELVEAVALDGDAGQSSLF
jgi:putative SOS response-associated peptidase YedK